MTRSRLRISNASDTTMTLHGPLGLRRLNGSFWKPWAFQASSSCHQQAPDASRNFLKGRDSVMGPDRARKRPSRCSFVNQELVLKQLAGLKEGHLRTLFLPFSDQFRSVLGTWRPLGSSSTNWALSGLERALPKRSFFLVRNFEPLPKKIVGQIR